MTRKVLWPVLVIGVALIVLPFALQMPSRTAAGDRMLSDFQPLMQKANVDKTAYYYDNVFVPLGKVAPAINDTTVARFEGYMTGFQSLDTTQLPPAIAKALPAMAQDFGSFIGLMKANTKVFGEVNAGLAHYKPLVDTMQANVNDFASVNAMPPFRLMWWFFVIPGVLLVLLAGYGLWAEGHAHAHIGRGHPTPA